MASYVILFCDRLALLRLLGNAGAVPVACLGVLMVATSLVRAVTAVAVAAVVGQVVEISSGQASLSAMLGPLMVVGGVLAFDQIGQSMLAPLQTWIGSRVNGRVRQMVRQAVSARPGISHLEDQAVRDDAALPVDDDYIYNIGAGSVGQLWLMARFVGAVAAAVVVAAHSVLAAVIVFAVMVWQRALLRRHYARALTSAAAETIGTARAAEYWSKVAGTQLGAKELRVFGFNDWAVDNYATASTDVVHSRQQVLTRAFPLHAKLFALVLIAALAPLLLIIQAGAAGELSATDLAAAVGGIVGVVATLGGMGQEAYAIEGATSQLAALGKLKKFHDEEMRAGGRRLPVASTVSEHVPVIRFEGVSFRYPRTNHDVISGLDLELRPGESVAIVGENGVGKTTLLKLLAGFYEPTDGRILVDGTDLRELDPAWWCRHLAVIFQEFVRFELSALDNVALADPDRTDAVEHAAAAADGAGATTVIDSLPRGWDTILSREYRNGADVSGGQWQRIALARALYAARMGGRILVLDEPTASLDVHAEVALFDQLLTHANGLTAVIVSHRYSTVRRANRIVVLEQGRVVEDGDHATLHKQNGVYARLYDLQANRFRHDEDRVQEGEPA